MQAWRARLHAAMHIAQHVDAAVTHEVAALAGAHAHAADVIVIRHRRVPEFLRRRRLLLRGWRPSMLRVQ